MRRTAVTALLILAAGVPAAELVGGLGGTAGFGEGFLFRNDDESLEIDISPVFPDGLKYFGTEYHTLWLNNNGNLTFGSSLMTYTPTAIVGNMGKPIIAAWFADVDTRVVPPDATGHTWSGHTPTNGVYYDFDTVNGIFTATWDYVGYYSNHYDKRCAFQIRLIHVGTGQDFDVEFRYKQLQWTTGDASGGSGGLGGTMVTAGYSASNGINYFQLPQSGNQSQMLALATTLGNTGLPGVWSWEVHKPVVDITPSSGYSNAAVIPFSFSVSQDATGFASDDIVIVGGTAGTLTGPVASGSRNIYTLPVSVAAGPVTVTVRAAAVISSFNDTNAISAATVIVDYTAPAAPAVPAVGTGIRPVVSGTLGATEAYGTVNIIADGVTVDSVTADATGAWSWQSSGLSTGTHSITVTATDRAGNTGTASTAASMAYTAPPASSSGGGGGGCGGGLTGLLLAAGLALGFRRRR